MAAKPAQSFLRLEACRLWCARPAPAAAWNRKECKDDRRAAPSRRRKLAFGLTAALLASPLATPAHATNGYIANTGVLPPASFQLGADNGAGFGWRDMDVFRLAAIWRANDQWTLRGGVSYASDFIDNDEVVFNILAPGTPKWHLSVGASYGITPAWRISGALTHAINQSFTGTNPFLTPGQPVKLEMNQTEFSLGMTYSW